MPDNLGQLAILFRPLGSEIAFVQMAKNRLGLNTVFLGFRQRCIRTTSPWPRDLTRVFCPVCTGNKPGQL